MRAAWSLGVLAVVAVVSASSGAGCGGNGGSGDAGASDAGDAGDDVSFFHDGAVAGLDVQPQNATLMAAGPGATLQFKAYANGSPTPVQAQWAVDAASVGTIDGSGLFTASGTVGGKVTIEAQMGALHGQTALTVALKLQDNPGNVPSNVQQQLLAGGNADSAFASLYPYDRTVFARGLLPPTLQMAGAAPDAVLLHVSFANLDYQGFYSGSTPGRLDVPPSVWTTITMTASGSDDVLVQLTKISGGQVSGPIAEHWRIAQGSLKGSVYYDTYDTPNGAAVMRIHPGTGGQAQVVHPGCVVCHSVSADGSTLVAAESGPNGSPYADWTLDLKNNAAPLYNAPADANYPGGYSFGGVYPDASLMVMNGTTRVVDPKTGAVIATTGVPASVGSFDAPSFSPSGKKLAFMHGAGSGSAIGMLDFDAPTKTFANLVDVATSSTATLMWPAVSPDVEWVVFQQGNRPDGYTYDLGGQKGTGDLAVAHVPSKTTATLDLANGIANGNVYLPFGNAEAHMNYEPSILPIAVGGYYWVVFNSRREYGNTINDANPYASNLHNPPDGPARRKKLWVAALDLDSPEHPHGSAVDISHPAFYLPGQDLASGNQHGSWALDPCLPNASSCASGDECCTGYCRQTTGADGGTTFSCVPTPSGCANEYEKCTQTSDCCNAAQGYACVGGYCAQPVPQ
jgi:hypothetical protein